VEYIKRSTEPECLLYNKEKWTKPWVDHYRRNIGSDGKLIKKKKPSDSHWTKNEIRNILIKDFKNNCGYCGCSRPTPHSSDDERTSSRGHVDHYRAKAIYPELTYEWTNYIWSCESCNVEKGEFNDPKHPILNPCSFDDCHLLTFIIDTGEYCLSKNNPLDHERFLNTDRLTMVNANEIIVRRRNRVKNLKSLFKTTSIMLTIVEVKVMKSLIKDNILNIKNDLEDMEFYFLIKKEYILLRAKYPNVASLIDND